MKSYLVLFLLFMPHPQLRRQKSIFSYGLFVAYPYMAAYFGNVFICNCSLNRGKLYQRETWLKSRKLRHLGSIVFNHLAFNNAIFLKHIGLYLWTINHYTPQASFMLPLLQHLLLLQIFTPSLATGSLVCSSVSYSCRLPQSGLALHLSADSFSDVLLPH